ncbi:oxidative stress-induced growth inhibitor 1-like [Aricia agestis]|uniref:oxidative stress-induced growth inhibitor 1-like n=1 Tax=Aricia agestis TaxID=91739 RepID=UPI001C204F61|nr:oxidative stress-induced growth inhibitor 1-like [Aricia agestis]
MRDIMKPCQHALSDVVYKDVVVIGNGPSGMVTSFMLAGNVPYLKHIPDDLPIDEMLKARLSNLPPGQNLLETDLIELAEGLEGRSQNPIPLLFDNLLRPGADVGLQQESLIEWRYDVDKQIDHVVLGKGPPGGAWQTFPGAVRTLSPAAWLSLPPHAGLSPAGDERRTLGEDGRVSARAVANYCRRYVNVCNLQRYFRSCVIVSSVTRAPRAAGPPCTPACPRRAVFAITGYDKCEGRSFRYLCRRVVLAGGAGDRPRALPPHLAAHAAPDLAAAERALTALSRHTRMLPSDGDEGARTVVVVGSGVSAADAVRLSRAAGLLVRHVHRAPADALARLTPETYPDYCQVYKMMCDGPSGNHPDYIPHPDNVIVDIQPLAARDPAAPHDLRLKRIRLLDLATQQTTEFTASLVIVLIGSKPDLFYLQTDFIEHHCTCIDNARTDRKCFLRNHWHLLKSILGQSLQSCKSRLISELNDKQTCQCRQTNPYTSGLGYGVDPTKPVDGKSNPIAIDKSTHEVLHAPRGMYALGPLTGDNFVRFIPGGAVALVAHLHRDLKTITE